MPSRMVKAKQGSSKSSSSKSDGLEGQAVGQTSSKTKQATHPEKTDTVQVAIAITERLL